MAGARSHTKQVVPNFQRAFAAFFSMRLRVALFATRLTIIPYISGMSRGNFWRVSSRPLSGIPTNQHRFNGLRANSPWKTSVIPTENLEKNRARAIIARVSARSPALGTVLQVFHEGVCCAFRLAATRPRSLPTHHTLLLAPCLTARGGNLTPPGRVSSLNRASSLSRTPTLRQRPP